MNSGSYLGIAMVNLNSRAADDADGGFGNVFESQTFFRMSLDESLHEARWWQREPDSRGRFLSPLIRFNILLGSFCVENFFGPAPERQAG